MKKTALPLLLTGLFACKGPPPQVAPTAAPWIDAEVENQAQQSQPGVARDGELFRGVAYEEDGFTDWRVMLDASKCYWFSGVGDQTVERLSLYLWDPNDKRITSNRSKNARSVIFHCPEVTGMYKLQAKVADGAGHYAVGVYSKEAPPKAAPPPVEEKAKGPDLGALLDAEAASIAPGATRVGPHLAGSGEDMTEWPVALEPNTCYFFIGIGGEGVKELSMYLWGPDRKRITENRADANKSQIGHCATQGGMFKVQAKVTSGEGDYKVGVYAKPQGKK